MVDFATRGPDRDKLLRYLRYPVYGWKDTVEAVFPGLSTRDSLWWRGEFDNVGLIERITHAIRFQGPLRRVNHQEFEQLCCNLLRHLGLLDLRRTGGAGDAGRDIVASTAQGRKVVCQCKRWRDTVGPATVRELMGSIKQGAYGILFTTSSFSTDAKRLAREPDSAVILVDGLQITDMILWEATAGGTALPEGDAAGIGNEFWDTLFLRYKDTLRQLTAEPCGTRAFDTGQEPT